LIEREKGNEIKGKGKGRGGTYWHKGTTTTGGLKDTSERFLCTTSETKASETQRSEVG